MESKVDASVSWTGHQIEIIACFIEEHKGEESMYFINRKEFMDQLAAKLHQNQEPEDKFFTIQTLHYKLTRMPRGYFGIKSLTELIKKGPEACEQALLVGCGSDSSISHIKPSHNGKNKPIEIKRSTGSSGPSSSKTSLEMSSTNTATKFQLDHVMRTASTATENDTNKYTVGLESLFPDLNDIPRNEDVVSRCHNIVELLGFTVGCFTKAINLQHINWLRAKHGTAAFTLSKLLFGAKDEQQMMYYLFEQQEVLQAFKPEALLQCLLAAGLTVWVFQNPDPLGWNEPSAQMIEFGEVIRAGSPEMLRRIYRIAVKSYLEKHKGEVPQYAKQLPDNFLAMMTQLTAPWDYSQDRKLVEARRCLISSEFNSSTSEGLNRDNLTESVYEALDGMRKSPNQHTTSGEGQWREFNKTLTEIVAKAVELRQMLEKSPLDYKFRIPEAGHAYDDHWMTPKGGHASGAKAVKICYWPAIFSIRTGTSDAFAQEPKLVVKAIVEPMM